MRKNIAALCVFSLLALAGCGSDWSYDGSFTWGSGVSSSAGAIVPSGIIGSGVQDWSQGYWNGAASNLRSFMNPRGLAVDPVGSYLYVADQDNHRVCRWDFSGQAQGWIGDWSSTWNFGDYPGSDSSDYDAFSYPTGVALYGGYIYVADRNNHRISRWGTDGMPGGWIGMGFTGWQTFSGNTASDGYSHFNAPADVCVGPDETGAMHLFVADEYNNRVCKWTLSGTPVGWIGGGAATWQTGSGSGWSTGWDEFHNPLGVVVDPCGNVYVADSDNNRVCKWDAWGYPQGWIGSGTGWQFTSAIGPYANYDSFHAPGGLCLDQDLNIYVADQFNHRVCKWDRYGSPLGWFSERAGFRTESGTGPTGDWQGFDMPCDVALDWNGFVYVVEQQNHRVSRWQFTGGSTFLGDTTAPAGISDLGFGANPGNGEYILTWSAVGDDNMTGRAFQYVIRSSTSPIVSNMDFDAANHHSVGMFPQDTGQPEMVTFGGFPTNTDHWFAIKVRDEAGNWSPLSNVISGQAGGSTGGDTTAPAAISLTAMPGTTSGEVYLSWTAVGDDDVGGGPASGYVLKCSLSPINNDSDFNSAASYPQSWVPLSSTSSEYYTIYLTPSTTYYLAIKAFDEVPNYGSLASPTYTTVTTPP